MGAGGYLQMVNATSYTWRRLQKYDYTYQVPSFNVADKILPGIAVLFRDCGSC